VCESDTMELAQAILESANIKVPTGLLDDCYDELGNHYVVPMWIYVIPNNLIADAHTHDKESIQETLQEREMINITVRSSTGKDYTFSVNIHDAFSSLVLELVKQVGVAPHRIKLFYLGKQLHPEQKMKEVKLDSKSIVQAMVLSS
jgi:hypothetical protein